MTRERRLSEKGGYMLVTLVTAGSGRGPERDQGAPPGGERRLHVGYVSYSGVR